MAKPTLFNNLIYSFHFFPTRHRLLATQTFPHFQQLLYFKWKTRFMSLPPFKVVTDRKEVYEFKRIRWKAQRNVRNAPRNGGNHFQTVFIQACWAFVFAQEMPAT